MSLFSVGTKFDPKQLTSLADLVVFVDIDQLLGLSKLSIGNPWIAAGVTLELLMEVVEGVTGMLNVDMDMAGLIGQYLKTELLPNFIYQFRVKPSKQQWVRGKANQLEYYGFGKYDLQVSGDKLVDVSLDCTTGLLMPPRSILDLGITDTRLSVPYLKFRELERFYSESSQRVCFIINSVMYFGFFENMQHNLDSVTPRKIDFTVHMKLRPNVRIPLWQVWRIPQFFGSSDLPWGDLTDVEGSLAKRLEDSMPPMALSLSTGETHPGDGNPIGNQATGSEQTYSRGSVIDLLTGGVL